MHVRVVNLRAPFRVASFEIRVTSKIRSRHNFRYKYGCLEISRGDATERRQIYYREKKKNEEVLRDCNL